MRPRGPWLLALGSLLLMLLFGGLGLRDAANRDALWQLQLEQLAQVQTRGVQAARRNLQAQAELMASTLAADPGLVRQMVDAHATLSGAGPLPEAELRQLQARLADEVAPLWNRLQGYQARRLAIYLAPGGRTLLRLPALAPLERTPLPLLAEALRRGRLQSALDAAPFGPGSRAVAPILDPQGAAPLGALEVSFGLLPPLASLGEPLGAEIALAIAPPPEPLGPRPGLHGPGAAGWQLVDHSDERILAWAQDGQLPKPAAGQTLRVVEDGTRHFLLVQVPLVADALVRGGPPAPPAAALTWQDVSAAWAEHRRARRQLVEAWWLGWLVAQALLVTVLLLHQRRSRQQARHREALRTLNEIASMPWSSQGRVPLQAALGRAAGYLALDQGQLIRCEDSGLRLMLDLGPGAPEPVWLDPQAPGYAELMRASGNEVVTHQDLRRSVEQGAQAGPSGSFIGIALWHEGKRRGLLAFHSERVRLQRFDDADIEFLRLLARWLVSTLSRERQERDRQALLGRAQKIASHLPGAMYQLQRSADGFYRFLYVSEGVQTLFGLDAAAVTGDAAQLMAAIHADDRPRVVAALEHSARELVRLGPTEYRVRHPQRGLRWIEDRSAPEPQPDGGVLWHGFIADVTARKAIEQRLVEERERAAGILEATEVGTWELHVPSGHVTVDARWHALLGLPAETLAECEPLEDWLARVHPDDREAFRQDLTAHFQGPSRLFERELRLPHGAGGWVWVRARGQVLRRDEQGRALTMYGVIIDITEAREQREAIRRTQAFLEAVVQASTEVAIIAADLSGIITLFNAGAERLLGLPADAVVGQRNIVELLEAEELSERARAMSAAFGRPIQGFDVLAAIPRTGTPETRQWRYRTPTGEQRLVSVTVTAMVAAHGAVEGYLGIATDVTELQEATRALQKSESHFRNMVANLPGVVYRCGNDPERTLNYLSEGIERLTGYPASDFVDRRVRDFDDLIHPDDRPTVREQFAAQAGGGYACTYRLFRADGRGIWVHDKSRAQHDATGRLLWIDGFIWDVSDRVHAEGQARERADYLRKLIANVIDGIVVVGHHGRIEDFNHAAERMFGYTSEEVVGHPLSLLLPDQAEAPLEAFGEALEHTRERLARRRDGERFTVELRVSEISHHGERKLIGLLRDITERKRIEQMKSEFVSIVSHELRTPLTSIAGALGLATGGALGTLEPPLAQMLGIAQQNSQRLARLIDDLLDMDKLVAGKMTFALKVQPLAPLLEEATRMTGDYARQYRVGFVLHPLPAECLVEVDEVRLQQVLANFLSNAAKFAPTGSDVEIDARVQAGWVRVGVHDRGPGVPDAFRTRIFEKFSQADSSDTRQKGGTGLGLAISKALVERMHGRIGFDSELGRGACFWFELPLAVGAGTP